MTIKRMTPRLAVKRIVASMSAAARKLDALHDKLVPSSGKAPTYEGEIVRAVSRIAYRWYNDGDYFFKGYGTSTAGSSATFLKGTPIPNISTLIQEATRSTKEEKYEAALEKIMKATLAYIESKKGKYSKNPGVDSREGRSAWVDDRWRDDDDDEDTSW